MASSATHPVRDIEFYKKLAQRDHDLIIEMAAEIGRMRTKLNELQQKYDSKRGINA